MNIKQKMIYCIGVALMILTIFAGNAVAAPAEYTVILDPAIAVNPVETEHTVTATVTDLLGMPAQGMAVTFHITSGPNAGPSGPYTTNESGEAQLIYTGYEPGIDIITLEIMGVPIETIMVTPAVKIWYEGTPIDLEKYTLGIDGEWYDADTLTGPVIPIGSPVKWKYEVTNNLPLIDPGILPPDTFPGDTFEMGEMLIIGLRDSDENVNTIFQDDGCVDGVFVNGLPQNPIPILPGQTIEYFACGTAVPGQYINTAFVDADLYSPGPIPMGPVHDEDVSHYLGVDSSVPSIDIEKSTNGEDADSTPGPTIQVGDPVLWEYVVTNDGNVPLVNVQVIDDQGVPVTCPKSTLAPGESMTCTASGVAVAGQYANIGTVAANDAAGAPVSDSDPSHYYGGEPGIPEFPTIALPVVAILGLALFFQRRKD